MKIDIPYKKPFDYAGLFYSYKRHQVGILEKYLDGKITRILKLGDHIGEVTIENDEERGVLVVETDFLNPVDHETIIALVHDAFDLGRDPHEIAQSLGLSEKMRALIQEFPGIRVPSGWHPFEISIHIILSQLVSVDRSRQLLRDLIEIAGRDSGKTMDGQRIKLFPTPADILEADLTPLKTTRIRKATLKAFSAEIDSGRISLEKNQDIDEFAKSLMAIHGIGKWTVECLIQRVLRHPDSFPSTDLIIAKALKEHSPQSIERMKPWRSYAAMLLWRKHGSLLKSELKPGKLDL